MSKLLLVHRGGNSAQSAGAIIRSGELRVGQTQKTVELDARLPVSLFFFFGAAAYPDGHLAFLVRPHAAATFATFTPFDTGSLGRFSAPEGHAVGEWSRTEWAPFLLDHCGDGCDLTEFARQYIGAIFSGSADYVRARAGVRSLTARPAYHRLVSSNGDRRAWTIEVRRERNLGLDDEAVAAIYCDRQGVATEFADVSSIPLSYDATEDLEETCRKRMT